MAAELMFTVVADDIRREQSRKFIVVGLYNKAIIFPEGKDKYALPQLCIFQRYEVNDEGHKARVEFEAPDGTVQRFPEHELRTTAEGDYFQVVLKMQGVMLAPGTYKIRTFLDGEKVREEPLDVRLRPADPGS